MNLLVKIWAGLLICAGLFIFSCTDPSDIGFGLDPDALSTTLVFEEFPLEAKNVFNDSLRTSNTNRLLVGRKANDIFGSFTSIAMTSLSTLFNSLAPLQYDIITTVETNPPGVRVDTVSRQYYVYDSVVINLEYSYVNTSEPIANPQTITVHQLDDRLISGVYYLSKFDTPYLPADPDDEFEFVINEDSLALGLKYPLDTAYVLKSRLSETIGMQLFDIINNAKPHENLATVFKGIALVPGTNNTAIVGFNPTGKSNITVHYHTMEDSLGTVKVDRDSLEVIFTLGGSNPRYNKIEVDRTGSLIGNSIRGNLEEFETGDDKVYLNPATGIYPKVSLQPILDFFEGFEENGQYIQITSAELRIDALPNEGNYNPLAANLRFLFMNEGKQVNASGFFNGDLRSTLVFTDEGYIFSTQAPLVAPLKIYTPDSTNLAYKTYDYRAPMAFFVQQLENGDIDIEKLALMPTDIDISNYSVFNQSDIKLRIYYALANQ